MRHSSILTDQLSPVILSLSVFFCFDHLSGPGEQYKNPDLCLYSTCTQTDLESLDPRGRTPLHLAVTLGHLDCARVLLQHGADVSKENRNGWTGTGGHWWKLGSNLSCAQDIFLWI